MSLSKLIVLVVLCLASTLLLAQQNLSVANNGNSTTGDSFNKNDLWSALITMLDEHKGVIAYDDFNRELLKKFDCHDEYNRTSIGTKGEGNGISDTDLKSHCAGGATIQFSGRTHSADASHFAYTLDVVWNPTSEHCYQADAALKLLGTHGWTARSASADAPRESIHFDESFPNSESFESKIGNELAFVTWVSLKNTNSLESVDPTAACLRHVDLRI